MWTMPKIAHLSALILLVKNVTASQKNIYDHGKTTLSLWEIYIADVG